MINHWEHLDSLYQLEMQKERQNFHAEGRQAFRDGKSIWDCPYRVSNAYQADLWRKGWMMEKSDALTLPGI